MTKKIVSVGVAIGAMFMFIGCGTSEENAQTDMPQTANESNIKLLVDNTEYSFTNFIVKTIDLYTDGSDGYFFIPYVKAEDSNNNTVEFKYCANHGVDLKCGSSDWLVKFTKSTGEIYGGYGGFFNTSDVPKEGYIHGSFSGADELSGQFEVSDMNVNNATLGDYVPIDTGTLEDLMQ